MCSQYCSYMLLRRYSLRVTLSIKSSPTIRFINPNSNYDIGFGRWQENINTAFTTNLLTLSFVGNYGI